MATIDELDPTKSKLKCLFTGAPGSGKSDAAASFPKPLIIDLDQRKDSLHKRYKNHPNKADIRIESFGPGEYEKFAEFIESPEVLLYKTLVVDSLMSLGRMAINYALRVRGDSGKQGRVKGEIKLTQLEDFGVENQVIVNVLEFGRNFKGNFILVAHLVPGAATDKHVLLTGGKKIGAETPIYFNEQWFFSSGQEIGSEDKTVRYKIRTAPTQLYSCKTVLNLPAEFDVSGKFVYDEVKRYAGLA